MAASQRFRLPDSDYASYIRSCGAGSSRHDGGGRNRYLGHIGDRFSRDESYSLLLELCSQEPTVLSCFKIIESTCLSRGIDLQIRGMAPTEEFRTFVDRYYLPFAENAIRYFFTLGFVPWRLRKITSGDLVPEIIPLGIFTWTIDSINNRLPRGIAATQRGLLSTTTTTTTDPKYLRPKTMDQHVRDVHQLAAQRAFDKRKRFFEDPKRVPYPLQGDVARMPTRSEATDEGKQKRLKGFAREGLGHAPNPWDKDASEYKEEDPREKEEEEEEGTKKKQKPRNTPAYYRQQYAVRQQQNNPIFDDDDTKILRYSIHFTENCNLIEDDVEIYEYLQPTNSIVRSSVLYGTVPSPLSHILIDYRNIRLTQIRLAHADAFNLQAKLICSYASQQNKYNLSEGNPIVASAESWTPQQRMGTYSDTHLPTETEANAFTRDVITENLVGAKPGVEHKPVVYTLPKNTTLENQPKLESIVDLPGMQASLLFMRVYLAQGKFIRDVSCLMGVPYEMVAGGYSDNSVGKAKSMHNTKTFITNMLSICRHLELLLADVYLSAYGGTQDDVKFIIRPTPRIEVNSVEEIVQLLETGVVSFDNAMHLSNMILGVDLKHSMGVEANAGQFSRAFITPSNKKDLIAAAAKKTSSSGSSK